MKKGKNMIRERFFEWLDAMTEDENNKHKPLYWKAVHDDGAGTLTIQFYNVGEKEEEENS